MDEATKQKIKKWIFESHEHHAEDEETLRSDCIDGNFPYVNSIELEKFIETL